MREGPETEPVYVALGDSISIDDYAGGQGRGGANLLARNVAADFPDWRGKDLSTHLPGLRWLVLAGDGATSRSVLEQQLPRLQRLAISPTVVTLTVGGNDVLSSYGDTHGALRAIQSVRARLESALHALSTVTVAGATVIVGTVYDPSDGTGDASRVGLPSWPEAVAVLHELNSMLRDRAVEHGARVADIHGRFLGHGLSRGNPAQTHPRPGNRDLWYCNVIEPNAWGANGVRAAFWDAYDARC